MNQKSEMMISIPKVGQSNSNLIQEGIKCQKCFSEPIKGISSKNLEYKDYNLCQKSKEENSNENFQNNEKDFIKIDKTKEKKKKYSYDCLNILNLSEDIYEGTEQAKVLSKSRMLCKR